MQRLDPTLTEESPVAQLRDRCVSGAHCSVTSSLFVSAFAHG